jgi:GH24 family phage-related lysozyme (muramidase)
LKLIQYYEGLKLEAYQDSVKVWTIGIGTKPFILMG